MNIPSSKNPFGVPLREGTASQKGANSTPSLSEEQLDLRRVLSHYTRPRQEIEQARGLATQQALDRLRHRAQTGTLTPEGVGALLQVALRCGNEAIMADQLAEYLKGARPKGLGAQPLIEVAVEAVDRCETWDWMATAWRVDPKEGYAGESLAGLSQRDADAQLSIWVHTLADRKRAWLALLFEPDESQLRDRLVERGVFSRSQHPETLSALLSVLLERWRTSQGDRTLPPLRALLGAIQAFGFDRVPAGYLHTGESALVRVINAIGLSGPVSLGSRKQDVDQEKKAWINLLVHAADHPWLLHDHSADAERLNTQGADAAPKHPLWCLAKGLQEGTLFAAADKEILPVIKALVALGYGVNGELPRHIASPGAPTQTLDWPAWTPAPRGANSNTSIQHQTPPHPTPKSPNAIWAFLGEHKAHLPVLASVVQTLVGLGADVHQQVETTVQSGQRKGPPQGLLAQLNTMALHKETSLEVVEAVFAQLVHAGLDPVTALPSPSVEQAAAGRIREWVGAAMERQELAMEWVAQNVSTQELREALAWVKNQRVKNQEKSSQEVMSSDSSKRESTLSSMGKGSSTGASVAGVSTVESIPGAKTQASTLTQTSPPSSSSQPPSLVQENRKRASRL